MISLRLILYFIMLFNYLNNFISSRLPLFTRSLSSLNKKTTYSAAKVASAVSIILDPLLVSKKEVQEALKYLQDPLIYKHLNSYEQDLCKTTYSALIKGVASQNIPSGLNEAQVKDIVNKRLYAIESYNSPEKRAERFVFKLAGGRPLKKIHQKLVKLLISLFCFLLEFLNESLN